MKTIFRKNLSLNDVGATGAHQGGILVPKTDAELLLFFPALDSNIKNPDAWIECVDAEGIARRFRYVYYNNKLHDENGTRNEYRITYMTNYFKSMQAKEGDTFEISRDDNRTYYTINIISAVEKDQIKKEQALKTGEENSPVRIKLSTSWRRIH
jgi:hypothetical protein